MMTPIRYVMLVLGIVISLHYILSFSHEEYGRATSLSRLTDSLRKSGAPYHTPTPPEYYRNSTISPPDRKANAAFVFLARNGDLQGVISSMKQMEDRFNKKYQYPWIFLNEEPFSEEFKKYTTELTGSPTTYGLISKDQWLQPEWIDEERATKAREKMVADRVIYGVGGAGSVPYRNMCRYYSGFFYRHELLKDYEYYWRVDPNVRFYCDLDYDPFLIMKDQNKVYGFTVSLYEYEATIPTLWQTTKEFIKEHPEYISKDNAMAFLSADGGETYNRCHFWSNFEIGDLKFWRGEAYSKYFEYLDKAGGFYYERWGDAPVHSIGAALFARKDQLHFFEDIGYRHEPFQHCPQGESHARGKCWCDVNENFDKEWYSCLKQYDAMF
ncbi:glycosyltransferase family 15 protein [Ramaria rubella]|nr:glycosyltransferase family 15 protein [Ramaria rubella]